MTTNPIWSIILKDFKRLRQPTETTPENEEKIRKIHQKNLDDLIGLVRCAQQASDHQVITTEARNNFLEDVDEAITKLCHVLLEDDPNDSVDLFGATDSDVIHTKTYKSFVSRFINEFMTSHPDYFNVDPATARKRAIETGDLPEDWNAKLQPNQKHSNMLSRVTPEYQHAQMIQLVNASSPDERDRNKLLAFVEAQLELRCYDFCNPVAMAIGQDKLAALGAGGYKERDCVIRLWSVNNEQTTEEGSAQQQGYVESQRMRSKKVEACFAGGPYDIQMDDSAVWVSGDSRLKAFHPETGKLLHTLSASGYDAAFAITNDVVFKFGNDGKLAIWDRSQLKVHKPVMFGALKKQKPHGGTFQGGDLDSMEDPENVEVSAGSKPSSKSVVPGIKGAPFKVAPWHGTSKFIFSLHPNRTRSGNYGIRMFDLGQPGLPSTLVGVGLGFSAWGIATNEVYPNIYVTAGGDNYARIWDYRQVLPQLTLDGHTKDMTACVIAPFGSNIPMIFTSARDEVIKTWDIRNTKTCLYDLSTGCMVAEDLKWHEASSTLFAAGMCPGMDRLGYNHDFRRLPKRPQTRHDDRMDEDEDGDGDEDEVDHSYEATYWPKRSSIEPDYYGKRWCSTRHSILEYKFLAGAPKNCIPPFDEPDLSSGF